MSTTRTGGSTLVPIRLGNRTNWQSAWGPWQARQVSRLGVALPRINLAPQLWARSCATSRA